MQVDHKNDSNKCKFSHETDSNKYKLVIKQF